MLLPRTELDESGDQEISDPRAELVRQLLEYKKFKDAANLLEDSASRRKERFTRPDSIINNIKPQTEPELDMDQVSIWTLLEAFDSIMQATGRLADFDHIKDDTPIDLYEADILDRAQNEQPLTFEDVFLGRDSRIEMVGLFLALLELIRLKLVRIEQERDFGPVYIMALTREPAYQAVAQAVSADITHLPGTSRKRRLEEQTDQSSSPGDVG